MGEELFWIVWLAGIPIAAIGVILFAGYADWSNDADAPVGLSILGTMFWPAAVCMAIFAVLIVFPVVYIGTRIYRLGARARTGTGDAE